MNEIVLRSVEQLGVTVRLKRKEHGLSQSKLAELLGVERKWVLRLESGNSKAELGLVLKALDTLDIRASLSDADRPSSPGEGSARTSRLDEVFQRLRWPAPK